ncbi:MAG TPA: transglutaminaseTgpA domain-containing protein, partial [Chloroflexota bacterium]|nr:transglutaminaseTgpA domain-containing protein [Chloroflexota bacterium]
MRAPAVQSGGQVTVSQELGRLVGIVVNLVLLVMVVMPPALAVAWVNLDPTLPFNLVALVTLGGVAVGMLFSYAPARGEALHPIGLFGGVGAVFYLIARALPDLPPEAGLSERLAEIVSQLTAWFRIVFGGGQATNNLLFLLLLTLIAWIVGYFGAWAVFRERSAWWPVTVSATALTLVVANFPDVYGLMLFELVGALLLIGRVNLQNREDLWTTVGLRPPGGVGFRGFQLSLLVALLLVALTWVAPGALASESISESLGLSHQPWQQAQREFNRLFGGLQGQNQAAQSGFGRALTLHGSFNLGDTEVLRVQSPKPAYWRAVVYDTYTNHGWVSSDPIDERDLASGEDVLRPPDQKRTNLAQQVTILAPRGQYLVGASQPVLFDQPVRAEAFSDSAGGQTDLVAALATRSLQENSQYRVTSSVSIASEADLRQASTAYPSEVRQRYLALPPVPGRVHNLAAQLTDSANNPYDKAVAVESYLRSLPYSLNIPEPPPNQDAV